MSGPRFGVWAPVYGNHGAPPAPGRSPGRRLPAHPRSAGACRESGLRRDIGGPARDPSQRHRERRAGNVVHPGRTGRGHRADRADRGDQAAAVQSAGVRQGRGQHRRHLRRPAVDQRGHRLVPARTRGAGHRPAGPRRPLRLHPGLVGHRPGPVERQARRRSGAAGDSRRLVRPVPKNVPPVYVGGESEPGRALGASHGDVYFINGRPLADTDRSHRGSARPAPRPRAVAIRVVGLRDCAPHRSRGQGRGGAPAVADRRRVASRDLQRHRSEHRHVPGARRYLRASAPTAARWPVWSAATSR